MTVIVNPSLSRLAIAALAAMAAASGSVDAHVAVAATRPIRGARSTMSSPTVIPNRQQQQGQRRRLDKDDKGPKKRECKIDRKDTEVEIECKTKTEDEENDVEIKDKIEYKVKAGMDGVSVKVEYKNEVEMDDVETETETEYEVLFGRLVEYVGDANDDGSYSFDANDGAGDSVVSAVDLGTWMPFSEVATSDDGVVSYFTLSSGTGIEFNFTISRADEGEHLSANKMKIDFTLDDFGWTQDDSNVALLSTVESKRKVEVEEEEDADSDDGEGGKKKKTKTEVTISFSEAIEGTGVSPFGEYTWATTAEATSIVNGTAVDDDGSTAVSNAGDVGDGTVLSSSNATELATSIIRVVATSPEVQENDKMERIAFSFVGDGAQDATQIYWDPEAGIGYASGAVSAVGVSMFGAVVCATTILAMLA